VKRLKAAVAAAAGVIFVTPEYSRSVPGVLKNALDVASRPYGQSTWAGQPEVFLTVREGFFDGAGGIANDGTRTFLQDWMNRFLAWVTQHQPA
jgi:chromate reductase